MTRDEYIRQLVDAAPPFSAETKARLWVLLAPVREALAANAAPSVKPRRRKPAA